MSYEHEGVITDNYSKLNTRSGYLQAAAVLMKLTLYRIHLGSRHQEVTEDISLEEALSTGQYSPTRSRRSKAHPINTFQL